uniref:Methyltransferase n=1 Tax=Mimivirus LCMiAC01 TaxID=2506608 RepID=A0A481YZM7_9VIRU|nr:MAG: methyltransferase [Mimivirus LCMiAC01]
MLLNPLDQYISRDLINIGTWESYLYPVFQKNIKKGGCVLDIGANIGCHSLIFSKLVGKEGNVHCFEPLHDLYFQLTYNLISNNCFNVTTYCNGVSDKPSSVFLTPLNLQKRDNFGARQLTGAKPVMDSNNTENIKIITIDSLNLASSFIKIDAEGMEDKVLLGSKKTLEKHKPIILIEIHQDDMKKLSKILDSLNYDIVQRYPPWDYLALYRK